MKDHQMLTEFGLKRRAISEYIMHTEKMNCGLWNTECLKHREKCEGKGFPPSQYTSKLVNFCKSP